MKHILPRVSDTAPGQIYLRVALRSHGPSISIQYNSRKFLRISKMTSDQKAEAILFEAVQPHVATDEGQKFLKGMATTERIKVLPDPVNE